MRQKLLIISSLIHNPDILFLDEPLSGLDANSVLVFKEVLSKLASEGKTIFYSSHIMEVVEKISSRIILLNNGQIAADGTFEELKKKNLIGMRPHAILIKDYERECDEVQRSSIKKLFLNEKDPIRLIKFKDIYEQLEDIADHCQNVANTMETIIMRNA